MGLWITSNSFWSKVIVCDTVAKTNVMWPFFYRPKCRDNFCPVHISLKSASNSPFLLLGQLMLLAELNEVHMRIHLSLVIRFVVRTAARCNINHWLIFQEEIRYGTPNCSSLVPSILSSIKNATLRPDGCSTDRFEHWERNRRPLRPQQLSSAVPNCWNIENSMIFRSLCTSQNLWQQTHLCGSSPEPNAEQVVLLAPLIVNAAPHMAIQRQAVHLRKSRQNAWEEIWF